MRGYFYLGICALAVMAAIGCNKSKTTAGPGTIVNDVRVSDMAVIMPNPDEPWSKLQIEYAQMAAKDLGITLHVVGVNGKTEAALHQATGSASASRAQGVLIQSPSEEFGVVIRDEMETFGIPTVAINTRLKDPSTKKYLDTPFHGIDNRDLGSFAATEAIAEATKRGWKSSETGVIIFSQLDGGKFAIRGQAMKDTVTAAGYGPAQVKILRWSGNADAQSLASAAIGGAFKNWLILGAADVPTIAGVRATESKSLPASNVIGVSIGGLGTLPELQKQDSGFFGTLLIGPKAQSYDVFTRLVKAIKASVQVDPLPDYHIGVWITRENLQKEMKEQMLDKLPAYASTIQP